MARRKDYDYFEAFEDMAKHAHAAASFLQEMFQNFSPDSQTMFDNVNAMHKIEHEADGTRHECMENLSNEFIPPIDREDIIELIQNLDNVVDQIDDVVRTVYTYNVREVSAETKEFADLIVKCTEALEMTMSEFVNFKKSKSIYESIIRVNDIEDQGDLLHLRSMRYLYAFEDSAMNVIRKTKLIDDMENCLDACEEVVDLVERVIMKNT